MTRNFAPFLARPIAHRGLHGCGGAGPVENTVAAAEAAIAAGYGIECDVQLSRDGEAMVVHDDDLRRLTGTAARCAACDAAAIGALRLADGSRIPTLASFLAAIGGRAPLVIEIKGADHRLADRVRGLIAGYAGPVALESFDAAIVARCADAPCPVGLVGPPDDAADFAIALPRCDFLSWRVDKLAAAAARRPDLPLTGWTVRDAAQRAAAARAGAQIVFEGFRP